MLLLSEEENLQQIIKIGNNYLPNAENSESNSKPICANLL